MIKYRDRVMTGLFTPDPPGPGLRGVTVISYSKLVYTVASIDTQCTDSNLESGRYISRVGRASSFLSLYGTVKLYVR